MSDENAVPWRSELAGQAHACGHDAHMAMLIGAARLLSARRDRLAGQVLFVFQPGEEAVGGADMMLDEGLLDPAIRGRSHARVRDPSVSYLARGQRRDARRAR